MPLPEKEESRRQRVERSEYYVKLLMNGNNFAGKSDARCLRSDFALDFCDVLRWVLQGAAWVPTWLWLGNLTRPGSPWRPAG